MNAKKMAEVCGKLPKGRRLTWKFTTGNLMVAVDADTNEVLSEEVEHPIWSAQDIADQKKLLEFVKLHGAKKLRKLIERHK